MHPVLIDLGFYQVPTYGVLLYTGIVLGIWLASRRAKLVGLPGDKVMDLGAWVVLWGLAGSKLLLVITDPSYLASFAGVWGLMRAGGVFYGGLIGALVAAVVLLRRYKLPFFSVADVLAPSVALGHFFGRLGCFSAGCCYGRACASPLGVVFTNPLAAEVSGTPLGVSIYPTQLFEAAFNLANYAFLAWLFRRRLRPGTVIGAYLIGYGVARFIIEFFRGDADRGFVLGGVLSTSQAIAGVMVPVGVAVLAWVYRRKQGQPAAQ
ncbi:MAG: prolipoprotein diacylglyceryl transferase [Thermoanaerobaculaceae bacterium]|nr:prolipoprotein diacylglyceryl transferase [Thermoanaerobaculaceae bacterium]TAM48543.1 MAG: prolipoprotein diacylglyceryl transferase [Acidobacteriota bacterium]